MPATFDTANTICRLYPKPAALPMALSPTVSADTSPQIRRLRKIREPSAVAILIAIAAAVEPETTPQISPMTSLQKLDT